MFVSLSILFFVCSVVGIFVTVLGIATREKEFLITGIALLLCASMGIFSFFTGKFVVKQEAVIRGYANYYSVKTKRVDNPVSVEFIWLCDVEKHDDIIKSN